MEFYLTENIIIKEGKTFYKTKDKIKKVNNNNWHHVLQEFGWSKISLPWIKILNKLSLQSNKNSSFGILDCESDGDCFFHCIANALNEHNRFNDSYEVNDAVSIRGFIADSITEEKFTEMISYYKIMKDVDDFDENWDPYKIKNIDDFRKILKESGHNYWCDYILLNEIIKILELNIFILNNNDEIKDYSVYKTLIDYNLHYDSVFLLFEDNCHFKLIGFFDGDKIISYFTENIPIEFLNLCEIR